MPVSQLSDAQIERIAIAVSQAILGTMNTEFLQIEEELKSLSQRVSVLETTGAVDKARNEALDTPGMMDKLNVTLFGDPVKGDLGLIYYVTEIKQTFQSLQRIFWIVLTAMLGIGITEIIYLVATHPIPGITK